MGSITDLEQSAHDEVVRLSDPELVDSLVAVLGAKLVAYLGGVQEARAVRQWATGERHLKSDLTRQRLQVAYRAARLIAHSESNRVAQSWFTGMNPILDDVSPARILRDEPLEDSSRAVMAAARQFVAVG